ncbi:MAG TPA: CopG family transcriptional regulator [Candidatus Magasanikbacteria bacterium]|nr:CopG family transcriptional regulator [Candidatus Magasanikbacteria bacterium]
MRTTSLITISLPPAMLKKAELLAKKDHMTRSELLRVALRTYLEEQSAREAIRIYKQEARKGALKELKGSLTNVMA